MVVPTATVGGPQGQSSPARFDQAPLVVLELGVDPSTLALWVRGEREQAGKLAAWVQRFLAAADEPALALEAQAA